MDSSRLAQLVATTGVLIGVATFVMSRSRRHRQQPALMTLIDRATERALLSGSMMPINTSSTRIRGGYQVLVATNLAKKPERTDGAANPFLPPFEEGLFVCDLRHHRLILNKFPVSSPHVIVVTKEFIPQESALTCEDFHAASDVLDAFDDDRGLCFFNFGPLSGFSQPHKHIQVVQKPDDMLLDIQIQRGTVPFRHYLTYYQRPEDLPDVLTQFIQLHPSEASSYNLLWTKKWFMIIPRRAAKHEDIGVNAMVFTGTIFVKTTEQAQKVEEIGGEVLVCSVGMPNTQSVVHV